MQQAVFNQLVSVRGAKANRIQGYLGRVQAHAETLGEDEMILKAMRDFGGAYQELATQAIGPDLLSSLNDFYGHEFLPKLAANSDGRPALETYFPVVPQAKYLQYHYLVRNPAAFDAKSALDVAADGSAYSQIHAHLHPVLRHLAKIMRYQDLLLISPDGEIVYSVAKKPDFGTSLKVGPYSESSLAHAYAAARQHKDHGHVDFADFAFYAPSENAPAAFFTVPLFEDGQLVGVLALQICIEEINAVMTSNQQWDSEGLGKTGEVYLVGEDALMRSDSRFLIEDKANYLRLIESNGVSPSVIARIARLNPTILLQPWRSQAPRAALAGQASTRVYTDYRGVRVLGAFAPVAVAGTDWGLVAKMDYDEAFAPVTAFERQVMLYAAGFVIAVTLLALWLTTGFVRPLHRLADAIRLATEGRLEVRVEDEGHDEIGALARAFNAMLDKQQADSEELRLKNRENESLLLNLLPAPIALRIKSGEQRIADSVASLTVLFADIIGFEDYSRRSDAADVVGLLNEIVSAFDEAAERHGVEKVKTIGSVYMAVSGLSIPRIDHIHRMVGYARDLVEIINRVNERHGLSLVLSVGINSGPAIAGIVGRQKFIYDLWGDTVTLAGRMQNASTSGGIKVTQAVKDALGDLHDFEPAGEFDLPGRGQQTIWVLPAHEL
jgi:class 3 adenylate cyclase